MLDASEYLHLAIHASQAGDHHAALNYLSQALTHEPGNASLIYFQAAEHAELGLYDRASKGMAQALLLDETLDTARFQLGLLHLQLQRPGEAREAFASLADRGQDEALRVFAQAYLALLAEDIPEARRHLEAGLAICANPALKKDMARILDSLSDAGTEAAPAQDSAEPVVYLGAYRDSLEPH